LLNSYRKRPRYDGAAEQRDELTTLWSIELHLQMPTEGSPRQHTAF
jgi:hypothetical protein